MTSRRMFAGAICAASLLLAATARAETLVAPQLHGGTFDLSAHRGHVVLVNFWATWCEPCREEIPALNAFYRRWHGKGLDIIGMSADVGRDRGAVEKMAGTIAYPVAMVRDATDNGFGSPRGLPVTYVFDRSGALRVTLRPDSTPVTAQTLESMVAPLISAR